MTIKRKIVDRNFKNIWAAFENLEKMINWRLSEKIKLLGERDRRL